MARKLRSQQLYAVSIDPSDQPIRLEGKAPFKKTVALWIPKRFLTVSGADLESFLADVNEKITQRGFILYDGQILTIPLGAPETLELVFEGDYPFDVPPRREWNAEHKKYFGLENPYQMAEESLDYTQSHVMTSVLAPYLFPDELIAAIIHGGKDEHYFYCPCHQADVVYTTRHRLVCMGCGAMHAAFRESVQFQAKQLLTADEWSDFFDEGGSRRDEELELSVVDFQDVESLDTFWTTDQWDEAKHRFIFFARSSPDVIEKAIRNTEADASAFLEAGFRPVATVPPPAYQVIDDSIDVDLVTNAAHTLREGVSSFLAARKSSNRLLDAIPALFRAIELLLKAKLQELDSRSLADEPNNPTVLKRLAAAGVTISPSERNTINRLRRLRNALQHGTAKFNHRTGLSTCREAIIFLNRFVHAEHGLWLGHAIPPDDWYEVLAIPELSSTADQVTGDMLIEIREQPGATISSCPRCNRDTLVRPYPGGGASCICCGHIPVRKSGDEGGD